MNKSGPALEGKRILLLFPHAVMAGGALNYTIHHADFLVRQGAKVGLLTMQYDAKRFPFHPDVDVITLDGPLTSSMLYWLLLPWWHLRLHREISRWEPDLLLPHVFPANWWAWMYKFFHRDCKILWMCHEPSAFIHSRAWIKALRPYWKQLIAQIIRPVLSRIDTSLFRMSNRVLVNSRYTGGLVYEVYGHQPDGVAYPGLDLDRFKVSHSTKKRQFVSVAKLTRFKRVDFLLRVFSLVIQEQNDVHYHIVGSGEELDKLKKLVGELVIAGNVTFHDNLDDDGLVQLLGDSMLLLHGCVNEPFGMAPIEAIACGTPVFAHKSGGPAEYITPECGRLIDSENEDEWATEIIDYMECLDENPDYFSGVASQAKEFSWGKTLRPFVDNIAAVIQVNRDKRL